MCLHVSSIRALKIEKANMHQVKVRWGGVAPGVAWGAEGEGAGACWACADDWKVKAACERAFSALRSSLSRLSASAKGSDESPSCMRPDAVASSLANRPDNEPDC